MKAFIAAAVAAISMAACDGCAAHQTAQTIGAEALPSARSLIEGLQASYDSTCVPFPSPVPADEDGGVAATEGGRAAFCRKAHATILKFREGYTVLDSAAQKAGE